ncbi:MAG TPA: efflux RND transporter periplasmic adaptor subunit [Acetobacteraceae bacterium]|nr:efflux RND transporter periplasmic adaptor subunit [Acetobacteraceae bacterium]
MQRNIYKAGRAMGPGEISELTKTGGHGAWRRVFPIAGAILVAAISVFLAARQPNAQQTPPAAATAPSVPVTVIKTVRQDVPVWLRGLGTVQALNTVLVRARVDGTLDKFPVTEGQLVRQGDLLAVIDPRPYKAVLDQAIAKKAQDNAQLVNARLDLQRYSALAKKDFASRQQVDTQVAMVNQYTATLEADDAAIEAAQLNFSFCYITAPFDGRVGLRQVDPGNLVHATDTGGIVTMTQVRPITVVFTLPQADLPPILDAMAERKLDVAAWTSDDKSRLATGTLLTPDNAIDVTTGTIKLKATFPNLDNRLWPGQFVDTQLLLRTEQNALTVPTQAVQHGPNGLYVYLVKPDSTVQRQLVQAEDRGPVMTVTKGLDPGETVVLDGQSRLENGMHIAATQAAAQTALTGG